jgi:hypothetical protein
MEQPWGQDPSERPTTDRLEELSQMAHGSASCPPEDDAQAQFNVGLMYLEGRGEYQKSNEKAFEWFLKAALQGFNQAQFNVGLMYSTGQGVEESKDEALKWFHKAALQGHVNAQLEMDTILEEGRGLAKQSGAQDRDNKVSLQDNEVAWLHTMAVMYGKGNLLQNKHQQQLEQASSIPEMELKPTSLQTNKKLSTPTPPPGFRFCSNPSCCQKENPEKLFKVCSHCRRESGLSVPYCSLRCQELNWPQHKLTCARDKSG